MKLSVLSSLSSESTSSFFFPSLLPPSLLPSSLSLSSQSSSFSLGSIVSSSGALPLSLTSTGDGADRRLIGGSRDDVIGRPAGGSGDGTGEGSGDGVTDDTQDGPLDDVPNAAIDWVHDEDTDVGSNADRRDKMI